MASTPRLEGRLYKPVVIEDLEERFVGALFQKRISRYKRDRFARLPISQSNFEEIFDIMRGNLRNTLNEADEFCNWIGDQAIDRDNFAEWQFERWLETELEETYQSVKNELRPTALRVFETACQFEVFSPSDCNEFGYDTPQAIRPQIKLLESVGLLQSSIEESDKRRKTIQVTPKGWKVRSFLDRNDDIIDV